MPDNIRKDPSVADHFFKKHLYRFVGNCRNQFFKVVTDRGESSLHRHVKQRSCGSMRFIIQQLPERNRFTLTSSFVYFYSKLCYFDCRYRVKVEMKYFKKHFIAAVRNLVLSRQVTQQLDDLPGE